MQHRLRPQGKVKGGTEDPGIAIVKDYGDLPRVECYPGQLNQVFMNILCNGIDALEEVIGNESWMVGDRAAGIIVRESENPIVVNTSKVVPHFFVPR